MSRLARRRRPSAAASATASLQVCAERLRIAAVLAAAEAEGGRPAHGARDLLAAMASLRPHLAELRAYLKSASPRKL